MVQRKAVIHCCKMEGVEGLREVIQRVVEVWAQGEVLERIGQMVHRLFELVRIQTETCERRGEIIHRPVSSESEMGERKG
jgi:hypothetical protein